MLLDIGEDHPREPEQLVEALARLLVEQRAVLLGEPIALALDLLGRPLDLLAVRDCLHVPDERRIRDARVVEPAPVVVVEPVAGRHVEPRVLHLLELLEPRLAGVALRQLVVDLLWRAPLDECRAHPGVDGETGEALELGIRDEEQHVDAGDHLGDVLVGDVGEDALAEVGERRVGPVAEEEELAVVLPCEVAVAQQAPVCVEHLDVPRVAIVRRTRPRRARTRRAQGRESQRDRRSAPPSSASTSRTARPSARSSSRRGAGRTRRARRSWRGRLPGCPRCRCSRSRIGSRCP